MTRRGPVPMMVRVKVPELVDASNANPPSVAVIGARRASLPSEVGHPVTVAGGDRAVLSGRKPQSASA
jgi:hypothetical protein